jgi:hypothetical protein
MAELRGFNRVVDNVTRRQEYERQHPAVTITHVADPWEWIATWTAEGSEHTLRDGELGGLLDQLDRLELA